MAQKAPGRFWIIRHPSSTGSIIAKFNEGDSNELEKRLPDEIADHSDFVVQSVSDRSTLKNKTVDRSGLSQSEKNVLRNKIAIE